MATWDPDLYLQFEKQRTQPAIDLAKRVERYHPAAIADMGCGPGKSTAVLKATFPNTKITGIDHDARMINAAKSTYPDMDFQLGDIQSFTDNYDMIFSNACLQWVPRHASLLPYLMEKLPTHGILAVQIPNNEQEPLFQLIKETVEHLPYDFRQAYAEKNNVLAPEAYFEILSKCSSNFDFWETVYFHDMCSHEKLIDWVRGSQLRPYTACLQTEERLIFEAELLCRVKERYPVMQNQHIILKFRRLFFVAVK